MPFPSYRHWLTAAYLCFLSILPAGAIDGIKPEENEALQVQIKEAEKGDANAQLHVGHCYFNGWGVKRNEIEAAQWYKKSADQGNETARFYLDRCRNKGANNEIANIPKGQTLDKSVADRKVGSDKPSQGPKSKVGDKNIVISPNSQQSKKSEAENKTESIRLILDKAKGDSNLGYYSNQSTYRRYRYAPAIAFAVWIIGAVVVFFMNIYRRVSLEKRLADDPRFTAKFFFHSKRLPIPETPSIWSSGWIIGGINAVFIGLFLVIGVGGVGFAFGLLLMLGGTFVAIYDYNHDISQIRQGPGNQLSEVEFHKDHLKATYSITGSKCYNFGPSVSISIQTRETYQNGVGLNNNNHSQMFTGIGVFASFSGPAGHEELELDFPGAAEFLAHCRHNGSELKLSLNCDARIVARLTESRSWQPGWQPDDLSQASEADHSSAKPKLWNPKAAALWTFLLLPAMAYWLHAANWRELGKHDKARRSMAWFYGYVATATAYGFILPYFLITNEILDFTWPTIFFTIWYFASGREQIRYFREANVIYEKKEWLKPVLTTFAICAAWIGIGFGFDEFFQASLRADAYRGDVTAQRSLAWMYANGKGVSEDQEESTRLYRKAAEKGDRVAQLQMGFRQREGKGMLKSDAEAFKWFRLAANQGDKIAEYMMGTCYLYGFGIPKDYAESARWHRKSAENGNADSQKQLGNFYYNGIAVKKDIVESLKWYRMAADQGDAEGQYIVGLNHAAGSGTEKNAEEALKWYLRAASQDYPDAQYQLAESYAEGKGATKDINEAIKWYKKSAERGNISAQIILGNRYSEGIGVTSDRNEAAKWYRKAAEQGSAYAQVKIGLAHESGDGADQNHSEAVKWFRKAAEQGDGFGQLGLGIHLISGYGVKNDVPAGLALIRKSASNGNAYALQTLGGYHVAGLHGLSKDAVEGYAYLSLAAPESAVARNLLAQIEKDMGPVAVASGKQRAQSLKKEIDEQIAARKAGK